MDQKVSSPHADSRQRVLTRPASQALRSRSSAGRERNVPGVRSQDSPSAQQVHHGPEHPRAEGRRAKPRPAPRSSPTSLPLGKATRPHDDLAFPKASLLDAKPLRPVQPSTRLGQQALELLNGHARSGVVRSDALVAYPLKRRPVEPINSNVVVSSSTGNSLESSLDILPAKTLVEAPAPSFSRDGAPERKDPGRCSRSLTLAAIADGAPLPAFVPLTRSRR